MLSKRILLGVAFLLGTGVPVVASAQTTEHEYRPELILTTPSFRKVGLQLLVEQHLRTENLFPNERILGFGLTTKPIIGLRFAIEARQINDFQYFEHRYIPTVYSTFDLGGGYELRNRSRVEFRDISAVWSHRYQDRTSLGRTFELGGHDIYSYGQIDLSYDSRFRTLNRIDKSVGSRYYFTKEVSIDLYFGRTDNTRQDPRVLYTLTNIFRVTL